VPNEEGHRIMADAAWGSLSGSAQLDPVSVDASLVLPSGKDAPATLQLLFHAKSGAQDGLQEIAIGVLGLDRVWVPQAQNFTASSNVTEGWSVKFPCHYQVPAGPYMMKRADLPTGEENVARGSLIVSEGATARLVNFKAKILPINVSFPLGRIDGASDILPVTLGVSNSSAVEFKGTAEVLWRGKTEMYPVNCPAGLTMPLPLKLLLPTQGQSALKHQLTVNIKGPAQQYEFKREIEISPNLNLNERVPLINRATAIADTTVPPSDLSVGMKCLADPTGFYLVLDLPTVDVNRKNKQPSARIEITLDARGPEQFGSSGHCEFLTMEVPWMDEAIKFSKIPYGVFGPGYDRELNPSLFFASVKTERDNRRQVRLSIPAPYFYLHEWGFKGQRQSTLGINAQVQLIHFANDAAPGTFDLQRTFSLVSPGMARNDATALSVVSLIKKPLTWSARIY
jgi:hypothetical protein